MVMSKKQKQEKVQELKKLIDSHKIIGVLNLEKIPGSVQLKVKNSLKDMATVRMSRKTILEKAIMSSNKADEKFCKKITGSAALIVSNENPFKLFKALKTSTVKSGAKSGQISPVDIRVPKGPTPIPPGPAISTFQKAGLKTKVEAGKISVIDEKVVVKQGDVISGDVVSVLNLLKIEPIEIGMTLDYALEDKLIYAKDVLDISLESVLADVGNAVRQSINLSVEINYPTKLSIEIMIQKAYREAKGLAVEANITEKEFIGDVLAKAVRQAKAVESLTEEV
ncbi:MAG: 50S ribosomal protein L10 [Candidatus Aenigmarchaeota archaeon]|nr:50S ribosomal protein L10 [Candidatus Aenigmarchaeota archaeon]